MTILSKQTIQHFIQCCHPLTQVSDDSEFLCKAFRTPGSGTRFRCEVCGFDLHRFCADCPMGLSSFMHKHSLELVGYEPDHVCDLCDDPIEGVFYRCCELCDFRVHPICTQLPEYTQHGMHKDHRNLKLEISVPIGCMVCKDMCLSWRYRCEVCSFHVHIGCTLTPPCEEETTMSKTSRSLGKQVPPQTSASPPAFDAYSSGYGYGGIPPHPHPQYYAQPSFPPHAHGYTYGGIPPPPYNAQPSFPPHVHAYTYGGIPPPPYYAQPSFPPHVHGYTYGGIPPPPRYFAHPSFAPHVPSYGVIHPPPPYYAQPSFPPPSPAQSSVGDVEGQGGKFRKRMYAIVRNLSLGVVCNVIAGVLLF